MSWYRTGTVAVTNGNTVVTGTGTLFAANARTGDAFIGPDGNTYEVTNIPTESAISIYPGYLGSTASGQLYAIAPMQGYVKASADRLREAVDNYAGILESIQPWATADTPAEARTDLELGSMSTQNSSAVNITGGSVADAVLPATQSGKTFNTTTTVSTSANNPLILNTTASTGEIQHRINNVAAGYTKWASTYISQLSPNTLKSIGVDNTSAFCDGIRVGNAANANTNVFDWYEEGSFTPSVVGATVPGGATYSIRVGRYQRVGNRVHFNITIAYTGHTGSGSLVFNGFPFSSAAITSTFFSMIIYAPFIMPAGARPGVYMASGSSQVNIDLLSVDGSGSAFVVPANLGTTILQGSYEV